MINFGGVRIILWICTLVYLLQSIYYPVVDSLFGLSYIGNENFTFMQLLTHGFLHGDLYHILINMIMLVVFASKIEMFFGTKSLFKIFLGSVFFGGTFQTVYNMIVLNSLMGTMFPVEVILTPFDRMDFMLDYGTEAFNIFVGKTLGASGGVFGCMIAFTCLFPTERLGLLFISFTVSARLVIVLYVILEIYQALYGNVENIAHFAHLGGGIFGLLYALKLKSDLGKNNA